ncbi:response regulator [Flaviaesturariibacter amylovorans]|uniref:Response regulatory domain-containing protein n=1 Tax=Flaviaesturariibacter amylovorans TaxID=1084520 RepID=A0ABP8H4Y4_9BACT
MNKGPIVIIEDDRDDQEIYTDAIHVVGMRNEIRFFNNGSEALEYLSETEDQPYVVISDVNMPGMSGFELRRKVMEDPYLASKGVPFVFISTNASKVAVRHAHALSVQGYFEKPKTMAEITTMFRAIFSYWDLCRHINNT